jgi:hypothetical protein
MKIFGININLGAQPQPMVQETGSSLSNFAFSTPFLRVGDANLSMPRVDRYYTRENIVLFGSDNLYPQLLNQMYYTSPLLGTVIDFITNATIGGGYSWTNKTMSGVEKVNLYSFEKKYKFQKLARLLTRDYIIHKRVNVIICKNEDGVVTKIRRVDPSTVRNQLGLECFAYSSDWSRGAFEVTKYVRYNDLSKSHESMYVFQDETPGQDIYPISQLNSILNWAFLDGEQAFFQKSNIQNAVFPSAVIRRPKEFSSADEIRMFKEEIGSKTGAQNGGKLIVLTGNGMDQTPEYIPVTANNNDKLFETTSKELKNNICFAFGINPSIMGIKVEGSLGNAQELEMSYTIFEKNIIMPLRAIMNEILNDLVDIAKIPNSIEINNYQIVEGIIQPQK